MGADESAEDSNYNICSASNNYCYDESTNSTTDNLAPTSKYSRIDGENMQLFMEDNPLEDEDRGIML